MSGPRLDNPQAGRYTSAARVKQITRHPGVFILPVAEEAPSDPELRKKWSPVSVVRAHAPFQVEDDEWSYEKEDAPPVVPDMTDAGPLKFLGGNIAVPVPAVNTAGGMTWQAAGQYTYVRDAAVDPLKETGIALGSHPYVLQSQKDAAQYPGPSSATDLPPEVGEAGVGPRVGWALTTGGARPGGQTDPTAPDFTYQEPSWFPATFFSDDLTLGPAEYDDLSGPDVPPDGELVGG